MGLLQVRIGGPSPVRVQRELVTLATAPPGVENGCEIPSIRPGGKGCSIERKMTVEEWAFNLLDGGRRHICRLCSKQFESRNMLFRHLERIHGKTSSALRLQEAAEASLSARRKARTLEREICKTIGPALRERGLIFVGIDVIGDWLTEINVTSPTGLQELERFDGTNGAARIWEVIEAGRAA